MLVSDALLVFFVDTKHNFCLLNIKTKPKLSIFRTRHRKFTWRRHLR